MKLTKKERGVIESEVIQGYEGVLQDRVYRRGRVKARVARARPSMNEGCQRYLKRWPPFLAAGVFTLFLLMMAFSQVTLSTVNASADLSITKSSLPDPVTAGKMLTYTINVTNPGPSDALNVVITEVYHENFVFSSSSPSPDRRTTNQWTFKAIQAGDTETISITGVVDPSTLESLSNTVTLTSDTLDPNEANNTSLEDTKIETSADLTLEKSGPSTATIGEKITYTIDVMNPGPSDALEVRVTDPVPSGTEYVSDSSVGTYDPAGGIWTIGKLTSGSSTSIDITVRILSDTKDSITSTAIVASITSDPDPLNNKATITTSVQTSADLSITKSSLSDPVFAGESLTYTINVTNSGPSDALNVVITEIYDANFIFSRSTPSPDSGTTNQWTFASIAAGDTETISITGVVDPSTLGSLSNTVSLISDTADPDPANNTTAFSSYILNLL